MTTSASPAAAEPVLGRATLPRLGRAVRSFVTSEVGGRARWLGALLLGLLIGINALNVLNSYVSRFFMTAIERREWSAFVQMTFLYVGVFAVLTATAVTYRFIEERLALLWREWLTRRAVGAYLDQQTYYRLNASGTLANPDQRIADDVRSFTTSTLSLALVFLNGTFTILAFSGVLWSISRWLFVVAVAYAVLGSVIAFVLGRPLVRLNYDQSDREANFRAGLIHVRENAESVALLHREPHLGARLGGQIDALTGNLRRIIAVNRNLSFFTTGYDYLIQILPVLIVAPLFIRGEVEFGTIPQSSMAFAHLLGAFSLVVKQLPQLTSYAAVLARLSVLVGATEVAAERGAGDRIAIEEDRDRFRFDRLSVRDPHEDRVIVRELSLEVPRGARVRISTPNEVATVAIERAIAGIWESGGGRIVRPPLSDLPILPDRPYLPPGRLRDVLVGSADREASDDRIWDALRSVAVDGAVVRAGGLEAERDWGGALSLEEQRLVSLARIFVARPPFAVLARLEAALGAERAERLLGMLSREGIGCLALGEGPPDRVAFEAVVEIAPDGSWSGTGIDGSPQTIEKEPS